MSEIQINSTPPQALQDDPPRTEAFLGRWARVKREVRAGAVPPGTVTEAPVVELPTLETLASQGLEGNFKAFMQVGVDEGMRRAAIQQLFKQPIFNVMDGLDVYIEDFNIYEPLTAAELPGLAHARSMLFPEKEIEAALEVRAQDQATAEAAKPLAELVATAETVAEAECVREEPAAISMVSGEEQALPVEKAQGSI
jgi:hypothetical protein